MNSDFSEIITLKRKERGLSQKQAAADLGISQALLSHYEKGIRECGLDFLVRIAEYYDVSCDYLLGREYSGNESISERETAKINSSDVADSVKELIESARRAGGNRLAEKVSVCLMMTVYKLMRLVSGRGRNFRIPKSSAKSCADAVIALSEAEIEDYAVSAAADGGAALDNIVKESEKKISELRGTR